MKKLISTLFTALFLISGITNLHSQDQKDKIKWYSFEEAVKKNIENPKPLFIDIYTEWCSWCKTMDNSTFAEAETVKYMNDNFYAVKFDAEYKDTITIHSTPFINTDPTNKRSFHQLAQALLKGEMSYPSYVFMNEKLEWLTVVKGFMPTEKFEPILHFFGEKAYENQSFKEFSKSLPGSARRQEY
jgi:thioredoxin-related protein